MRCTRGTELGVLPMTSLLFLLMRSSLPSLPLPSPCAAFPFSRPLFFRTNAVGTILFQLCLRINPLFDVSRLLAIKRANGTRWRVAPCKRCECDGRRRLHKQQDGRRRRGLLRRSSFCQGGECAATPAWPADERVVLRKERTARVPCQFFPNVWPFEILARPHCKANHSSSFFYPPPSPTPISLLSLAPCLRRLREFHADCQKTTNIHRT